MSRWGKCLSRLDILSCVFALGPIVARPDRESLLRRFGRDQSGTYMIVAALAMPVLVGTAGLGTEAGWWLYTHKNMQSAADSAAVSAATSQFFSNCAAMRRLSGSQAA